MKSLKLMTLFLSGLILVFSYSRISNALDNPGLSGAHFWGDANGNGMIDGVDLTTLRLNLRGVGADYSNVIPPSGFTQELSGNNLIDGQDLTYLRFYMSGDYSPKPGHPNSVIPDTPSFTIYAGDSVVISAYVLDSATASNGERDRRAGWGVVFRVNTAPAAGRCTDVMVQGRDLYPQGEQQDSDTLWFPGQGWGDTAEAFAYTLDANTPDNGLASVKLLAASSCANGDSIEVSMFIPGDSESHALQGRNPSRIEAQQAVRGIFLLDCIPCDSCVCVPEMFPVCALSGYGDYCWAPNACEAAIHCYEPVCFYNMEPCDTLYPGCSGNNCLGIPW